MTDITKKAETLLESIWTLEDIINYCGCSKVTAEKIRDTTLKLYGKNDLYKDSKNTYLNANDVLKVLGTNRLESMQVLKMYREVVER